MPPSPKKKRKPPLTTSIDSAAAPASSYKELDPPSASASSSKSSRASKSRRGLHRTSVEPIDRPSEGTPRKPSQAFALSEKRSSLPHQVGSASARPVDFSPRSSSTPTASSITGHLMSSTPYRESWLSSWIEQPWQSHVPPGFIRMKDMKFQDSYQSPAPVPITAVILAGQAIAGRLFYCSLVSSASVASVVDKLCDSGFGPNGTVRAKFSFESLIQDIHSAVLDGRVSDLDLNCKHHFSPALENILCKSAGFSASPPTTTTTPRRTSTTEDKEWWKTKSSGR